MRTQTVALTISDEPDALLAKAVGIFVRRWSERTRVPLQDQPKRGTKQAWTLAIGTVAQPTFCAAIQAAGLPVPVNPQSYAIASTGRVLTVCGTDGRGVLYGLGHLLRNLVMGKTAVPMPVLRECRSPAVYNRGVYFATHFNNYYEAAPVEKIERYVEEMALMGFDLLMVWFDVNWFPYGFWKDPRSRGSRMAERIRRIGVVARSCGMKVGTAGIGNEGFASQPPPELRADIRARHGGFYPLSQICPSKPGGLEMILENRRQATRLVGPLDFFVHWPYDQGGCGCDLCAHAPGRWGRKFLELGPRIAEIVRQANPDVRVYVSTWLMDEAERGMVYDLCDRKADWFQGLLTQVEHVSERRVDARYERLVFPEISMFNCYFTSYGCNGANPAPTRFASEARKIAQAGAGTALYSEGIYEDINKAVYAARLWDPDRELAPVLEEYARYYFGHKNVKAATGLITALETTWGANALLAADSGTVERLAREARNLMARIPRRADALARGRLLSDRAEMDRVMKLAGPGQHLIQESRALLEGSDYLPSGELRKRLKAFLADLRERKKLNDLLFDVYWRYMRFFHMEKTNLLFLPDTVMGKYQWETLIAPLAKAAAIRQDAAMRLAVTRAFKRWSWFNGLDFKYLFF